MKEYLIKSIVTALVFIGLTLAFDAIFNEIGSIWKYLISGGLFGFIYEGWLYCFEKGVFSKEKDSSEHYKQLKIGLIVTFAFAFFFGVMLIYFIVDKNLWMCVSMALLFIVFCGQSIRLYKKIKGLHG